jgi:hypothetical protein
MAGDAIVGRIVALMEVDNRKFVMGMGDASKRFASAHSDMTSKSKQITSAISGIGAAMVSLGAVAFLKDAVTAAIEDEVAVTRLKTSVEATGAQWGVYASQMNAAAIAGVALGFEDANTTAALAALTLKTGDASKALKDISLAQNLARGTGMDLAAASSLIAKVEGGRIGVAARVLSFLKTTMTVEEALGAIRERTAGQAAAYANTAAGAAERWAASSDKLQESIGYALTPTLKSLVDVISPVVLGFAEMDGESRAAVFAIGAVEAAAVAAMMGFKAAAPEVVAFGLAILAVTQGAEALGTAAGGGGHATVELGQMMIDAGYDADGFSKAEREATGAIKVTTDEFEKQKLVMSDNRSRMEELTGQVLAVRDAQKAVGDYLKDHGKKHTAEYNELLQKRKDATDLLAQVIDNMTDKEIKAAIKTGILSDKMGKAELAARKAGKKVDDLKTSLVTLPSGKTITIDVNTSQYDKWLSRFAAVSGRLNLHVYGSTRTPVNMSPSASVGSPQITPNAMGGVYSQPTLGLLGEAPGITDVVVPSTRDANSYGLLARAASMLGRPGGGDNITYQVTVYADSMADERKITRSVEQTLAQITRAAQSRRGAQEL